MGILEDGIADAVLAKFGALPAKSKPLAGTNNWIPLSGIVFTNGKGVSSTSTQPRFSADI
jgi:hypothetical protein